MYNLGSPDVLGAWKQALNNSPKSGSAWQPSPKVKINQQAFRDFGFVH